MAERVVLTPVQHWSRALLVYGAVVDVDARQHVTLLLPGTEPGTLRAVTMPARGRIVLDLSLHGATRSAPARVSVTAHWCPAGEDELLPTRVLDVGYSDPGSTVADALARLPAAVEEQAQALLRGQRWEAPLVAALSRALSGGVELGAAGG